MNGIPYFKIYKKYLKVNKQTNKKLFCFNETYNWTFQFGNTHRPTDEHRPSLSASFIEDNKVSKTTLIILWKSSSICDEPLRSRSIDFFN